MLLAQARCTAIAVAAIHIDFPFWGRAGLSLSRAA